MRSHAFRLDAQCSRRLGHALGTLSGVESATVDSVHGVANVRFDPSLLSAARVREKVRVAIGTPSADGFSPWVTGVVKLVPALLPAVVTLLAVL